MEYLSKARVIEIISQYIPDDDGSCSKANVDLREMLDEIENEEGIIGEVRKAIDTFIDGGIALYVENEEIADTLYRFCYINRIEMDYPNGEGRGIQVGYTYRIIRIPYIYRHNNEKRFRPILKRHRGRNIECEIDVLNGADVFKQCERNDAAYKEFIDAISSDPIAQMREIKEGWS